MSPELEHLITLQQVESAIADAKARIAAHPQRVAAADARLSGAMQVVEAVRHRLKDNQDARRELELDPDPSRLTVLIMSGGFGWGPVEQALEVVLSLPERVQAAVICGRNEGLRRKLAHRVRGMEDRIKISGFTDRVDLFMAAADVMVGKSGGLTTSEAMARGLPMIVFRPIPGQEERNCDFLQETGAGVRVYDYEELHFRLMSYLMHPEHLEVMRAAAGRIGRPKSSHDVARALLT